MKNFNLPNWLSCLTLLLALNLLGSSTLQAQITEDFETAPLTGWTFYQTQGDDPGFVQTSAQAHGGSSSFFHNDDNIAVESDAWMVSPSYTCGSNDELKFWFYQNWTASYYVYHGVWISTASNDPIANPTDFVELEEFGSLASEDTWTEKIYNLASYSGQTIYVAFKYTGDWADELYIDDFSLDAAPTCLAPTALTATGITATSATLEWTVGGAETLWNIEIGVPGFTPGATTPIVATASPYPVSGLAANTSYDFYVQADCGGTDGTSTWAGPFTFTTLCGAQIPDYTQDFATFLPDCWTEGNDTDVATGPNGDNGAWTSDGFMNVGTTGAARINLWNLGDSDWLVSPAFDIPATGTYQVQYDFGITLYASTALGTLGSDDQVQFLVSTDNGATWTALATYDNTYVTPAGGDLAVSFDLAAYAGQTVQFAFWATEGVVDDIEDNDVFVDNFAVLEVGLVNDLCANAITLNDGDVITGTTTDATATGFADCGGFDTDDSGVWYTFEGTGDIATISTEGSTDLTDTQLQLYDGTCGALNCVAFDDDSGAVPVFSSVLTYLTTPGTTYFLYVDGYTTASGDFNLAFDFSTPPPAPENDLCENAITLNDGDAITGTTTDATATGFADCGSFDTDDSGVWYTFVGTGDIAAISTEGSTDLSDTQLQLYSGDCGALTCLEFDDDDGSGLSSFIAYPTTAGTTYYVYVDGYNAADGEFNLSLDFVVLPENDLCTNAIALTSGSISGSTEYATNTDAPSTFCSTSLTGAGLWYTIDGTGTDITVSTCGASDYDTKIGVFSGTCDALQCVDGNDDSCGLQSSVTFASEEGVTYYVYVTGFGLSTGNFTLNTGIAADIQCRQPTSTTLTEGECEAMDLTILPPVVLNDFGSEVTFTRTPAGNDFPVGTTVLVWTATNAEGGTTTCESEVIVVDEQGPIFSSCNTIQAYVSESSCVAPVQVVPEINDPCGLAVNGVTGAGTFYYAPGYYQHEVTAVDVNGVQSSHTYEIFVHDVIAPTFQNCPDEALSTVANSSGFAIYPGTFPYATDNCSPVNNTYSNVILTVGENVVTFTAEDPYGNISECVVTVNVAGPISLHPQGAIEGSLAQGEATQDISWNALNAATTCAACAETDIEGFKYVGTWWGHQYFLANETSLTREDAQVAAETMDAYLAVINTEAENNYLVEALGADVRSAWIGLMPEQVNGVWTYVWDNAETSEFSALNIQDTEVNADTRVILTADGTWEDATNAEDKYFLIERPCVNFTQTGPMYQATANEAPVMLRSGDAWAEGSYEVTYQLVDICGNESVMTFPVDVMPETAEYCTSAGADNSVWIDKVVFHELSNNTESNDGYGDFTADTYTMNIGDGTVLLYLEAGGNEAEDMLYWRVFGDRNNDGDFFDANEILFEANSTTQVHANINVEAVENMRLRVVVSRYAFAEPCGDTNIGEIEDYTVNLVAPQYVGTNRTPVVKVFPNPADTYVNVYLKAYMGENVTVTVRNSLGNIVLVKEVAEVTTPKTRLTVSDLNSGMYFISVEAAGKAVVTKRLNVSRVTNMINTLK